MARYSVQRKNIFVNNRIQGSLLWRIFCYWMVYHLFLWHTVLLLHFMQYRIDLLNGGEAHTFGELYGNFTAKYLPLLLAAMAVLPLVLYDSVQSTHRVAGPLLRFRNTLKQLRNGERIEKVQLRKGDLLVEFQQEFNEFLEFYHGRIGQAAATAPSRDSEPQLLSEVRSLSHAVGTACEQRPVNA